MQHYFLRLFAGVALALAPVCRLPAAETDVAPDVALNRLLEGNRRFVGGATTHPDQSTERRAELAQGQQPFAVILTCADSRVSPEILFDQGLGDIFVIRNAGNLVDDHVLGSIEYAVEHLHARLVVVLGHTKCGAVSAAVAGGAAPGHLASVVESLSDAVSMARRRPGEPVDNAVRINARLTASAIAATEPILAEAVRKSELRVVAARYDVATGQVEVLP